MKRPILIAALLMATLAASATFLLPAHGQRGPVEPPTYILPPNEPNGQGNGPPSKARLDNSPRHGEWVDIKVAGSEKPLHTWVVYPERPDKAPVVLTIMEIFGMTDWVRATADQLAADGFIAVAPDFLSTKEASAPINSVSTADVVAALNAARDYALKLPSANGKSAVVGFCWGGSHAFDYAIAQPDLNAAVAFYGSPPLANGKPDETQLAKIKAPIAGFFGQSDARVTVNVVPTQDAMKKLNKPFEPHIFDGAGHGFMRQQGTEPNAKAAKEAWPLAIQFIKDHTK